MTEQWRSVTRLERADFYADWIATSQQNEVAVNQSPVVARGRDLTWIETENDYRLAMLIGPQVGFPSSGTNLCKAIIPAGHHTGEHRHGEEAIHVTAGTGFIVVDGRRYGFRPGTTFHIPYRSDHQFFNTGTTDAAYITASSMDLDLFVRLGRLEQLGPKGRNEPGFESAIPPEDGQFDTKGRRIALHLEDAPDEEQRRQEIREAERRAAELDPSAGPPGEGDRHGHGHGHSGEGHGHAAGKQRRQKNENPHRHGAIYVLMGGGESRTEERNGFTAVSVAMTNVFEEVPHSSSHCHSHTEAVLYVLEGVGFSEIDYEHYDWEAGDAVHVPPKMTRHEHFNPSDQRTRTLRIEYGIRYFYEPLWPGYDKVEHRDTAMARP
jgi:mannose-6-phosphate isomerase-like protein (cupin superfamily)